jgi:FixJ family two-component response regulator
MSESSTVYVVDDDEGARTSTVKMVASVGHHVEAYACGQDFLERFDPERESCLVLDVRMREMSGLKLLDQLDVGPLGLPVIFLTGYGDVATAVRAMKSGAVEFLEKPARPQDLLEIIDNALAEASSRAVIRRRQQRLLALVDELSPRQKQILAQIVQGKSTKEVAFEMGISSRTVDSHRSKVMETMGMKSTVQIVREIARAGLDDRL